MAASCPPKRRRWGRKNQTRQGHQSDASRRRQRLAHRLLPGQRQLPRGQACRARAADGTGRSPDARPPAPVPVQGPTIAFTSARDGNYEIYKMNEDGSNQTNLTNNAASDIMPAWSPDGTKIAFTRF